jgi:hypothetical protein
MKKLFFLALLLFIASANKAEYHSISKSVYGYQNIYETVTERVDYEFTQRRTIIRTFLLSVDVLTTCPLGHGGAWGISQVRLDRYETIWLQTNGPQSLSQSESYTGDADGYTLEVGVGAEPGTTYYSYANATISWY